MERLLGLLALRDVRDHGQPGEFPVGVFHRRVEDVVPAAVPGVLHIPLPAFAVWHLFVPAPGAGLVQVMERLVAETPGGVVPGLLYQTLVHELNPVVGGADVHEAVERLDHAAVARLAGAQLVAADQELAEACQHKQ